MAYDSILQPVMGILMLLAAIIAVFKGIAVRNNERDRAVASLIAALLMGVVGAVTLHPDPPLWTAGVLVVALIGFIGLGLFWQFSGRADHSRSRT